ncbi:hypothetical protein SUGI_0988920 [Cryptomeria japonica]|uniref:F-box/kelch-repeat protein At1g80440 n=1 Tax=Cryptomeria japonica TaxID=3369 RepID=UPI002414A158|nr:F-box/kelch-repeat protein At1g80440 [Cryptomeria japonica]GLJ46883.1 hypothetical protein SUGI_0988920 [Cryptomeria japonica]
MGCLFPRLPDEIGMECLVRVKLKAFHNLRCVCKSWNAALKSPQFYQERKRLKISEQRICMLQKIDYNRNRVAVYDPNENSCKSLPPIPAEIYGICHFHFVKQKLVLIKDMHLDPRRSFVWLYDFRNGGSKWRQGAKTPTDLSNGFASGADEHGGVIYVAGGFSNDEFDNPVRNASVYNVEEDKWDVLPDMNTDLEYFRGAFADGKFYVMGIPSDPSFEVFDSYTRSWKTMENRFNYWRCLGLFQRRIGADPLSLL